jgi:hypothetical protein
MYVYIYIYVYIHIYTRSRISFKVMRVQLFIATRVLVGRIHGIFICVHIYIYVCICIYSIYIYINVYMNQFELMYIYEYIYMHDTGISLYIEMMYSSSYLHICRGCGENAQLGLGLPLMNKALPTVIGT